MSTNHLKGILPLTVVTALVMSMVSADGSMAAPPPVKEVPAIHFGAKVNATNGATICTVESGDTCQSAEQSPIPGGFAFPEGVAVAPGGDLYIADQNNRRVQELEADGTFVRMFGRQVNETAQINHETANEDICPANPGDKCKKGLEGTGAVEFTEPSSVTIDPVNHRVYVADIRNQRVQEFTEDGHFILMIGKDVNETTGGNVCTQEEIEKEGVTCKAGVRNPVGSTEQGALDLDQFRGDLLAVGGLEDLLYVADRGRVQEFKDDGTPAGEIVLSEESAVTAITVDEAGNVDLVYSGGATIHKFDPTGKASGQITLKPRSSEAEEFLIRGLAVDASGRLAVSEYELTREKDPPNKTALLFFGSLLEGSNGRLVTEFFVPARNDGGMTFDATDHLYLAVSERHEALVYAPFLVAELMTGSALCNTGAEHSTDATFDCVLKGEVNPYSVTETEIWFEWGKTCSLGLVTPKQEIVTGNAPADVSAPLEGLPPNEVFCYRLAGEDHNVKAPEKLTSETASFTTPIVPPRIVGKPVASFVKPTSTVIFGELNPENALTTYLFEYGQCESPQTCSSSAYPSSSGAQQSGAYGKIGTTVELTGLQPATVYHYRLFAESENKAKTEKRTSLEGPLQEEGVFETSPAPTPQAVTGGVSQLGTSSATVTGTINPDGLPASYSFEMGLYNGASTRYATVFTGPAGAASVPVEKELTLTGLQPATEYAFRIAVSSGYINNETHTLHGTTVRFMTEALPLVPGIVVPEHLHTPFQFPKEPPKLTPAQELKLALKACRKKPKKHRASCERTARKRYRNQIKKIKKG